MLSRSWRRERCPQLTARLLAVAVFGCVVFAGRLSAAPINPEVFKKKYDEARKDAAVVAQVRVLAVVCTELKGEGRERTASLQITMQVLDNEKGPIKKNEVLVVAHKINLPAGPGPGSYGYWAALRQFPSTAGVKGAVALNWDKQSNRYVVVAGWVPEPNMTPSAIPTEVGKAYVAGDAAPGK